MGECAGGDRYGDEVEGLEVVQQEVGNEEGEAVDQVCEVWKVHEGGKWAWEA